MRLTWLCGAVLATSAFCQTNTYPYVLKAFAGAFRVGDGGPADTAFLGDGGPALSAFLDYPSAAIADPAGNLYILDQNNQRIRKVTADGKIATFAQLGTYGFDMKLAPDGSLYVAALGSVLKVSTSGVVTYIAGNNLMGYAGDGGPAITARVGALLGIASDGSGNIYFTDAYGNGTRVRMVGTDGKIRTIAGTATYGFNGDNQPAASASLSDPQGIAVDNSGNIYVADGSRIRKFTVGGVISTIAGNGVSGQPANGPATGTSLGQILGLYLDSSNNLYAIDTLNNVVLKISTGGTLTRIAGNFSPYGASGDGIATSVSILDPRNISWHSSGSLYITDSSHLIRKLTPDGSLTTVAGKIHFGGDSSPAIRALLNEPTDVALDRQGNVYIADAKNFRIRKVAASGTISTISGNGIPGIPLSGTLAVNAQLPFVYAMAADSKGALYLATFYRIFKITPDGILTIIAGAGALGSTGDGGPATAATIEGATSIAVDVSGNVYFADGNANRVRKIAAGTGTISLYAGSGTRGFAGDGGLASGAQLDLYFNTSLAVDSKANLYIGDGYNSRVRMVTPGGIITTVVGNGSLGRPDGLQATAAGFTGPAAMACDDNDNLYIASQDYGDMYRLSGGVIHLILGAGPAFWIDGTPALWTSIYSTGIKVDPSGDIYATSCCGNTVLKLVLNSPAALTVTDGNSQAAQTGQPLPKPIRVQLNGRAGAGVSGVDVSFTVTSGSAILSAPVTQTDSNGFAGVGVTLGTAAGTVTIAATAAGTGLPGVQFSETGLSSTPACTVPQPVVASVNQAGDFGGGKTFAPGSWLEIKGTNLAQNTRSWGSADFIGAGAPITLDGVAVAINGKRAYVGYISPTQINVQAPGETVIGNVQLTVTTSSCTSSVFSVPEAAIAPGMLAPVSFNIGGTQYLVATYQDGVTFVGNPALIPGVPFRPAMPGDNITAYGIGFGPVTPTIPPGLIASGTNTIADFAVSFGGTPAKVTYSGLAPGSVGLYQFNFVVPDVADGDYSITFQAGSVKVTQSVYLTVHK